MLQEPVGKVNAATQCEAEEATAGGGGPADPIPSADPTMHQSLQHGTLCQVRDLDLLSGFAKSANCFLPT